MQSAEQRSQEAISRCRARWLEPDEPVTKCANCEVRIPDDGGASTYKCQPVCSQGCWDELLERDR
jgi:hypothetical protein